MDAHALAPSEPGHTHAHRGCCSNFGPWECTLTHTAADGAKYSIRIKDDQVLLGPRISGTILSIEIAGPGMIGLGLRHSQKRIEVDGGVLRLSESSGTPFLLEYVPGDGGLIRLRTKDGSYLSVSELGAPLSLTTEISVKTSFQLDEAKQRIKPMWEAMEDHPFDEKFSTHLWIFNRAVSLIKDINIGVIGFTELKLCLAGDEFRKAVAQGIYDADNKGYFDKNTSGFVFSAHFYSPEKRRGGFWDPNPDINALNYGVRYINESLRDENSVTCGRKLGLALHYLQDLTQPMHCGLFPNIPQIYVQYFNPFAAALLDGIIPNYRHGNYERWALSIQNSCALNASQIDPWFAPDDAVDWGNWFKYAAEQGLKQYKQWTGDPNSPLWKNNPTHEMTPEEAAKLVRPLWVPATRDMLHLAQRLVVSFLLMWGRSSKLIYNVRMARQRQ
jgi:hypothetical protein